MNQLKLFQNILVLVLIFLFADYSYSQKTCGTQILHEKKMKTDPQYAKAYRAYENSVFKQMKDFKGRTKANCATPQFFPVAIHFDWVPSASQQAELIKLAQNQIATLNSAFNGNDCQGTTNSNCFEFVLADKGHPAASGLADGMPAVTFGGTAGADYCATSSGTTNPCNLTNWAGYMNITVNRLSGGQECMDLGVSHLPGNPTSMNSMSVNSCAFGSIGVTTLVPEVLGGANCTCLASSVNGGTTVVHEIGHFLGLFHTFCADDPSQGANGAAMSGTPSGSIPGSGMGCQQASVCSSGCTTTACDCDMVSDTPAQAYSNNGCPGGSTSGTLPNPSDPGNMHAFSNFMDYVDDACMNCFSQGQYARVTSTLASGAAGASGYRPKSAVVNAASTAANIPTMGQWGLIILAFILMIVSVLSLQSRAVWSTNKQ